MTQPYFSEKNAGAKPRTLQEVPANVWGGIVAGIQSRVTSGSFGYRYPEECPDGRGPTGTNEGQFAMGIAAHVPEITWPLRYNDVPPTPYVLDLIEFCHDSAAKPIESGYHSFFEHYHLAYDLAAGQEEFRAEVNRIFARNGLAFELGVDGRFVRLAPPVLEEELSLAVFTTGDPTLDQMLESARRGFLSRDPATRLEALKTLWDAWERSKTVEAAGDKRASTGLLLDKAATEPTMRELLELEARQLTDIGNEFLIRHSEVGRVPVERDEHVDYLFHRLFALIYLLLRSR